MSRQSVPSFYIKYVLFFYEYIEKFFKYFIAYFLVKNHLETWVLTLYFEQKSFAFFLKRCPTIIKKVKGELLMQDIISDMQWVIFSCINALSKRVFAMVLSIGARLTIGKFSFRHSKCSGLFILHFLSAF